jgi:hypothetical protein
MIHGAPVGGLADFVSALREKARYLFVTSLSEGCYQNIGDTWEVFVESMSENSAKRQDDVARSASSRGLTIS